MGIILSVEMKRSLLKKTIHCTTYVLNNTQTYMYIIVNFFNI